eukprot:14321048-Alexandrium_andersonii.AAC.1
MGTYNPPRATNRLKSATPRFRVRCVSGVPRLAHRTRRPELQLKGSPTSADSERGTRALRPA